MSVLLLAFIDSGLIEALVELGKKQKRANDRKTDEKATILLGELLHMSDILLPASQCAKLQVSTFFS